MCYQHIPATEQGCVCHWRAGVCMCMCMCVCVCVCVTYQHQPQVRGVCAGVSAAVCTCVCGSVGGKANQALRHQRGETGAGQQTEERGLSGHLARDPLRHQRGEGAVWTFSHRPPQTHKLLLARPDLKSMYDASIYENQCINSENYIC